MRQRKREEAGRCIKAAHVHLLAKAAPLASALAASYAVSPIVLARPASTSPATSRHEETKTFTSEKCFRETWLRLIFLFLKF